MPAWWGKKSSRNDLNKKKSATKSFDDFVLARNSPRVNKDFISAGSSGFSGFDSDSVEKRGVALGSGSASASVSSVSSSGLSAEDHPTANDHLTSLFGGGYRSAVDPRGNGDVRFNTGSRSPGPRSRSPGPGSRSPDHGPPSRGASRPASPLHPLLGGMSLESHMGRLEDGKNQCHPLPLPPSSPTSPCSLPAVPSLTVAENTMIPMSRWKKGKLLGRGTFGHVFLGFNRMWCVWNSVLSVFRNMSRKRLESSRIVKVGRYFDAADYDEEHENVATYAIVAKTPNVEGVGAIYVQSIGTSTI